MINYEDIRFPNGCKGFIDVTQPPYCLDNTGKEDCTKALVQLLDDILEHNIAEMQEVYDFLLASPVDCVTRSNNSKRNGFISAFNTFYIAQQPTIYFPNGTYLISDTISYTLRKLQNKMFHQTVHGHEMNRCIRFMGQNREKTVIKLQDNCKGFEWGQQRPVINFMQGERSNVSYSNYFENITVDVGAGNPGAIGLVFFANNNGAVRNVTIRSSDPEHQGYAGIVLRNEIHSGANFYDVEVDGFDYGVQITTYRTTAHFENIVLRDQQRYGFYVSNTSVQIIGLRSYSQYPALNVADGTAAHVVLTNAVLEGGDTIYEAIKQDVGSCLLLRDVDVRGYAYAVNRQWRKLLLPTGYIDQYCYPEGKTLDGSEPKTLKLPVAPMPDLPRIPVEEWVCVNDFGATGDGETDDTAAIQAAFQSGKKAVWFQPGLYLLSKPIQVGASVEYVNFMFCDLAATEELKTNIDVGMFHLNEDSDKPLFLEKLQAWYECMGVQKLIWHDCKRELVMRDIHSQACASYFNTVPGSRVHMENVACTIGNKKRNGHVPCFSFRGQTVWLHAINPERCAIAEVENIGGTLWWSGFKAEQESSICVTREGGITEIMGGVAVNGAAKPIPMILNDESTVCASFSTVGVADAGTYPVAVKEIRDGEERIITDKELPARGAPWYFCPLYSGYKKG